MKQQETRKCANCGTVLPDSAFIESHTGTAVLEYACPTCQFQGQLNMSPETQTITSIDLEGQFYSLIDCALASGIPPDRIQSILCDAVTFVAQCACPDHQFSVVVVDLGAPKDRPLPEPFPDLVEILRHRYVSGAHTAEGP